jgi:type IV pilus assembly protein PilN
MRISINLASRPFVELRPLFARLRLIMGALAVLAVGLGFGVHAMSVQAKKASAAMDALKAQTAAVQQKTGANEARMRLPQNQGVLQRSQFLNALFAQKSFSWTGVMVDLERVLPEGVQVTNIEPVVSKEGEVTIRLRVTGDRDKAIQLVRNLERTQRFVEPRLVHESALTADKAKAFGAGAARVQNVSEDALGSGVEFEINSGYNPVPAKTGSRDQGAGGSKTGKKEEGRGKSKPKPVAAKPIPAKPVPARAVAAKPAGGAR